MRQSVRFFSWVGILAMLGIFSFQLGWLVNYYRLNKMEFGKEVNLAFEDAIKKEFSVRCDTLEQLLYNYVSDTANMTISSSWSSRADRNIYSLRNRHDSTDKTVFSLTTFNEPIRFTYDSAWHKIARQFARMCREEDLERHIIFYRTQTIGKYLDKKATDYQFDTARLRPIFRYYLSERGISESFQFRLRDTDSLLNRNEFPDSLSRRYPVITKAFPTYLLKPGQNYVRAVFASSSGYLFDKMKWLLIGSLILLGIVGATLYMLLYQLRQEKQLTALRNDFINNISHELKTPVATVLAAVEAMEKFDVLERPVRAARYLEISRLELQRLSEMVHKILDMTLYERQDFEWNPEQVAIDDLIRGLISGYSVSSGESIDFNYVNHSGLQLLKTDKFHLHNMIGNLVENAVKYGGNKITISLHQDKDFTILTVRDNGPGIPRQHLPFVFDKFYRVPVGNLYRVKGFGLGLSYIKAIMTRLGGWCRAESQPGGGSTFTLGLPLRPI